MFEKLHACLIHANDTALNRNICGLRQKVGNIVCAVYCNKILYIFLSLNSLKHDQVLNHVSAEYKSATAAC
jgi:hypothetical protein